MRKTDEVIECVKNQDGTFVPKQIVRHVKQPSQKPVCKVSTYPVKPPSSFDQNLNDFFIGMEAGLDAFSSIVDRVEKIRRRF